MNQLGFLHWTVHDTKQVEGAMQITASYDLPPLFCLQCGHPAPNVYRHETRSQIFMDTPMHGNRCGILWLRKRYKCLHCGKTFFEEAPDLDERHFMTKRLVTYIELQSLRRPFTHLAHEIGVDEKVIRNIFNRYVANLDKQAIVDAPEWLGIDELTLAQRPRCIFTDVKLRRIVGLISNRKKPAVTTFLSNLRQRDRVQLVTIDMWTSYRDAARDLFPKADIIIDKFHVVRYANDGVEVIRKGLKDQLSDTWRKGLKRDRYVLLKRKHDLKEKDLLILDAWLSTYPTLKQAYELKESFHLIWDCTDRKTAIEMYEAWYRSIPVALMPAFKDLTSAMTNWHHEIFNYFDHPVTNAYTEALNGLIKVSNRVGRGYSFEVIRAKMLYDGGLVGERRYFNYRDQFYSYMMPLYPKGHIQESPSDYAIRLVGREISTLTAQLEQGTLWSDSTN